MLISSCIIDEVYTFRYKIVNNSGFDLSIYVYDNLKIDTITIPNCKFFTADLTEDPPFSLFHSSDSIQVKFSDNKSLNYYYEDYCNHGKNLYCPDSYLCEQLDENIEKCEFTFTDEDYLKAK